MTSGAVAEDGVTAGTEPGDGDVSFENYPPEDPINVIDDGWQVPVEGIAVGEPDPTDGDGATDDGAVSVDGGTPDELPGGEPDIGVTADGGASECGGCEYQNSAGPVAPASGAAVLQRAERAASHRAGAGASVKNSCTDPERYVAWICDWQRDFGLIGQ